MFARTDVKIMGRDYRFSILVKIQSLHREARSQTQIQDSIRLSYHQQYRDNTATFYLHLVRSVLLIFLSELMSIYSCKLGMVR